MTMIMSNERYTGVLAVAVVVIIDWYIVVFVVECVIVVRFGFFSTIFLRMLYRLSLHSRMYVHMTTSR